MSLELIIGPMFAGKSSAILQRVRRAQVISQKVFIVTCSIDTRYDGSGCSIKTHDKDGMKATGVKELREILTLAEFHLSDLVMIEEAQFFPDLYEIVLRLVEINQKRVIVVGLDGDSERKPFGQILDLVPIADTVTKLTALCKRCNDGTVGLFSGSLKDKDKQVCVGGTETYEPMCRRHYLMNMRGWLKA